MISRANYLKVRAFLEYVEQVTELRSSSVKRYQFYLRHLLVWLGENRLGEASKIRPWRRDPRKDRTLANDAAGILTEAAINGSGHRC